MFGVERQHILTQWWTKEKWSQYLLSLINKWIFLKERGSDLDVANKRLELMSLFIWELMPP